MDDLLLQGLNLMLVGMTTVFVFLTLLVGATTLMSKVVTRFVPTVVMGEAVGEDEAEVVAAIAAALDQHRRGS